jgi:hypothetical protein
MIAMIAMIARIQHGNLSIGQSVIESNPQQGEQTMKKQFIVERFEIDPVLTHYSITKNSFDRPLMKIERILEAIDDFDAALAGVLDELQSEGATVEEITTLSRMVTRACNRSIDHYRDLAL